MSWDVSIFAAESSPAKIEQPGEDLGIMPLGSCESVRQKLSAVAPQIDWKDPSWGILEGDGYIIEFNLGDVEPCDSVMLHIRGSGADNNLIDVLKAIPAATGWYVFDHTQEEWFHHGADPERGLAAFNALSNALTSNQLAREIKPFWKLLFGL